MKVKTTRTHFEPRDDEVGLEKIINDIGYENVLQIMPTYYGGGEVAYTIIYKEKESEKANEQF